MKWITHSDTLTYADSRGYRLQIEKHKTADGCVIVSMSVVVKQDIEHAKRLAERMLDEYINGSDD